MKTTSKASDDWSGSPAVVERCVLCLWGVLPQTGLAQKARLTVPRRQWSVVGVGRCVLKGSRKQILVLRTCLMPDPTEGSSLSAVCRGQADL